MDRNQFEHAMAVAEFPMMSTPEVESDIRRQLDRALDTFNYAVSA